MRAPKRRHACTRNRTRRATHFAQLFFEMETEERASFTAMLLRASPLAMPLARPRTARRAPCGSGGYGSLLLRLGPLQHHQCRQPDVRGQYLVKPDRVQPGPRHQRRKALHDEADDLCRSVLTSHAQVQSIMDGVSV